MPRILSRHNGKAFSLIEILAALAIFGLCIVALIEGISQTLSNWRLAEDKTKALMLAQNVIEEIVYSGELKAGEDGSAYEPPDERFSWSSVIDETEIPGLFSVAVSIAWTADGHERDVTLTTLRMQRNASTGTEQRPAGQPQRSNVSTGGAQ